jgi:Flp pilus assembly protein TadG
VGARAARRFRGDESGAALVEFAIASLMLIMLILGMVELAELYRRFQALTDAAREGARFAVVSSPADSAGAVARVKDRLAGQGIVPKKVTVTGLSAGYGNTATVNVEYDYRFSFVSSFTGARTVPLKTLARMRIE